MRTIEPAIVVNNVSKRFSRNEFQPSFRHEIGHIVKKLLGKPVEEIQPKPFYALQDINITINRGESVAIIGRNGSGKTTLLRLMSRISEPTKGEIYIRGRYVSLIGLGAGFISTLTGYENIYLNAAMHGLTTKQIDARIDQIIEFSELGDFINLPTNRYSSGMMARLGFSIAFHVLPEIVFLDEVISVGDIAFQEKCSNMINTLLSEDRTIVLVSHSTGIVKQLCKRTIWLHDSHLVMDDRTEKVLPRYSQMMKEQQSKQAALRQRFDGDIG
ncbi:MAG: ABC transporter ATP-binding protein [Anaerolineae bacterium]|nr:ABC transporter ATP-binding protein [Anaerolineae bacterium]